MRRLAQDGTAEPILRDQILRRERGQGDIHFPGSSANHEQDWQLYPVDPYSCCMCDHTTYIHNTNPFRRWCKERNQSLQGYNHTKLEIAAANRIISVCYSIKHTALFACLGEPLPLPSICDSLTQCFDKIT